MYSRRIYNAGEGLITPYKVPNMTERFNYTIDGIKIKRYHGGVFLEIGDRRIAAFKRFAIYEKTIQILDLYYNLVEYDKLTGSNVPLSVTHNLLSSFRVWLSNQLFSLFETYGRFWQVVRFQ